MVQELNYKNSKSKVAIIGAGPAGCLAAYYLQDNFDVTLFDYGSPLRTLLPTGGGRCNLGYAEYDFKELVKYYPRGEKFLYSVFSKFATGDTLEFFNQIGVETYMQDDMRIFPMSNSAKDVRESFLEAIRKSKIKREKVLRVDSSDSIDRGFFQVEEKCENTFVVVSDVGSYSFDKVVISTGGHASYNIMKYLGHNIIEPKPALVGLKTRENFKKLAGVSFKNIRAEFNGKNSSGDLIFTHEGVSGPLAYSVSSIMAREKVPYTISFDFCGEVDLQFMLNENPHKSIKNLLSELVPKSFTVFILEKLGLSEDEKSHRINGKIRDEILALLNDFNVTVVSTAQDGEVVTSGGVDLKEINPKTMESKLISGIYFCGEVLDIDGSCGGFNLQNCWSTGYVVAQAIQL